MPTNQLNRVRPKSLPAVAGLAFPAFIHNSSYFFTELDAYADGVFECWGAVDLDYLARKFAEGWITTAIPAGQKLSVHELVHCEVSQGRWTLAEDELHERLLNGVRELNPTMTELVDFEGSDVEERDGVRYAKLGFMAPTPRQHVAGSSSPVGESRFAFVKEQGRIYLTSLRIYADGAIDVHPLWGEERLVGFEEFSGLVKSNIVGVQIADGDTVQIDSIGEFEVSDVWLHVKQTDDFLADVQESLHKLNGRATAVDKCRSAFQAYLANPTIHARDELKAAYEAMPEHHRRYVGDMDTKDVAVRMIIYGEGEIERWTHRQVARARGEELPTIDVPKPIDE